MDIDDLEPQNQPKKAFKPTDVTQLSIEELQDYIAFLNAEIGRADGEIAAKKSSIDAADQIFKK